MQNHMDKHNKVKTSLKISESVECLVCTEEDIKLKYSIDLKSINFVKLKNQDGVSRSWPQDQCGTFVA